MWKELKDMARYPSTWVAVIGYPTLCYFAWGWLQSC